MDKEKQIKSTDWLTKNYSKEELAEIKAKADKEAEEELKQKQIEEMADIIAEIDDNGYSYNDEGYEVVGYANSTKIASVLIDKGYRKERRGEWKLHRPRVKGRNATYKCSVCGKLVSSYYNDVGNWKCCPHCGARMKGE